MKLIKKEKAKVIVVVKTNERKGNTSKSICFSEGTVDDVYDFIYKAVTAREEIK